ncbi:hypothetical protein OF83DRAFT_442906 [Amylostereum chailletii]|nr:hypothetical protein OF83DRAFT_442906 [Amylostereum chailletii]
MGGSKGAAIDPKTWRLPSECSGPGFLCNYPTSCATLCLLSLANTMPKDRLSKNLRSCSPSPYEKIPYRPFTRGEEDVVPLWRLRWPRNGQLSAEQCRTRSFDHFTAHSTIQTEIEIMRKIESGQYIWHDGFSDDSLEEVEAQLLDDCSPEIRVESPFPPEPEPDEHGYLNHDDAPDFQQEEDVLEIMQPPSPPQIVLRDITPPPIAPTDPAQALPSHEPPLTSVHPPPSTPASRRSKIPRLLRARAKAKDTNAETAISVQRFQRRVRSTEFNIVWFVSFGEEALSHPHPVGAAAEGDIYVHKVMGGSPQTWLRNGEDLWLPVAVGDVHPRLPTHCLNLLPNGDPSWVTKKTVTTYRSRARQHAPTAGMRPGI